MLGYSQVINSGSQAFIGGTRTQLINDALGPDTFSTETLWNPINNRINLRDARVGDYLDVTVIIGGVFAGLLEARAQLDFSPTLDGSQVVGATVFNLLFAPIGSVQAGQFKFVFVVTQPMKDNGIGIMVTFGSAITVLNSRIMISRQVSET